MIQSDNVRAHNFHTMNLFLPLAIVTALASAMPAAGTSEATGVRSMLRKAHRSVEVVASHRNETSNATSQLVEVISYSNKTGVLWYGNETTPPLGQLPMEDLARRMQIMTDRDIGFLESHNTRRKAWHERYNKRYVPLKWDNSLKAEAKVWAVTLLDSCGKGMYHDPGTKYGECATANQGTGSFGKLHTPDEIIRKFVEREENWQPPKNSHLTQVLWRSTKFVGCAEASKSMGKGTCHTQVCRYARPGKEITMLLLLTRHNSITAKYFAPYHSFDHSGNCNLQKYKSDRQDWWIEPMLLEEGGLCGPECPPNGCH
jgi:hypothetical protein